ncbi:Purple acid phosphatase [Minicystis rosea]|nr:Purple acid phosphatase [Minicystis rosea]
MRARLLLALVAPALVFAACGGGNNTTTTTSTSTTGTGGQGTGGSGGGVIGGSGGGDGGLPCTDSGVSKGPWSLRVDDKSAIVRWEACRPGTKADVVFSPEGGGAEVTVTATESPFVVNNTYYAWFVPDAPADLAGTYYMHEASLTGLAPATCYSYHLAADANAKGRFCTARPSGDPLTFWAIGDTNPGIGPYAAGVVSHLQAHNPDFLIHGADLQYYSSGLETWASWFPVMQPMLSGGAFYPAIGNHESEKPDEQEQYATRFFGNAGFDGNEKWYRFQSAGVWFFSLDTEEEINPGSEQGGWLVDKLKDASEQPGYRFSIVYMHKPIVTCGDTGDRPDSRSLLEPIFAQYHVPLVVQAHMHGYERFDFGTITYVTTGGGGGALGNVDENIDRSYCGQRVVSGAIRHGVLFELSTGSLKGTAIDYEGKTIDEFTLAVP